MDESGTRRVTVEEAAQLLGIEKASVKKRVQRGKLRSEKATTAEILVALQMIEDAVEKSKAGSPDPEDEDE